MMQLVYIFIFLLLLFMVVYLARCIPRPLQNIIRAVGRPRPTIIGAAAVKLKNLSKHPRTKSEQMVIDIFEKISGKKFPTAYPSWLIYKGKSLELDGYNDELGIGVEFSGPLHTKYYPNKESYEKYEERLERDRAKIGLCKQNGIILIVIDMSIPKHHLYAYINSRLFDAGVVAIRPLNYLPAISVAPYEKNK